jgi:hypothetical protein
MGSSFAEGPTELISSDRDQPVIRIEIGSDSDRDTRAMVRRIARLEQAVRDLQNRVYQLEDRDPTPQVVKFNCSFKSCRQSTSIHDARSGNNCTFFRMWRDEKQVVWAVDGREASSNLEASIRSDKDIVHFNSLSCNEAR